MKQNEIIQIIIALVVLFLVIGVESILLQDINKIGLSIIFAFLILFVNIGSKKLMALYLGIDIEHEIWQMDRYGFKPGWHLKRPIPMGVILPIFITVFSLAHFKFMAILTYDTKALKKRVAKKFGPFSFKEVTDWHNSLIGAAGIISILLLSFITYWFTPIEPLWRICAYYVFFNLIPFSKLDGSQIFYGSKLLYTTLAIITLIFTLYALFLP